MISETSSSVELIPAHQDTSVISGEIAEIPKEETITIAHNTETMTDTGVTDEPILATGSLITT